MVLIFQISEAAFQRPIWQPGLIEMGGKATNSQTVTMSLVLEGSVASHSILENIMEKLVVINRRLDRTMALERSTGNISERLETLQRGGEQTLRPRETIRAVVEKGAAA
ncbi:hypothetical protein NL108_011855 [Boleophthalmus pectinirostris]|nr:hypothetical protein NL108_011855 [Boleophthalmus pectinirostris]